MPTYLVRNRINFRNLVAVLTQRSLDLRNKILIHHIGAAEVSLPLGADANVSVACTSSTMLHFAVGGDPESLFDSFMSFHLVGGHVSATEPNCPNFRIEDCTAKVQRFKGLFPFSDQFLARNRLQ